MTAYDELEPGALVLSAQPVLVIDCSVTSHLALVGGQVVGVINHPTYQDGAFNWCGFQRALQLARSLVWTQLTIQSVNC